MATGTGLVPLPSNIYAGGAVKFDTTPVTNYLVNEIHHQKALQQSAMKYYSELGSKLTPTGMVDEDAKELIDRKNNWQAHMMQNRKQVADPSLDGGSAYMEGMRQYNDMQDLIAKSKYKSGMANRFIKPIVNNPEKFNQLTDESKEAIRRAGLPVTNDEYRPFSPDDIKFKEKQWGNDDVRKLQSVLKSYKPDPLIYGEPVRDEKTGTQSIPFKQSFGNEALNGMSTLGEITYHANHNGFKDEMDNIYQNPNSQTYQNLNNQFKKHFGKDIQSPLDVATAYMIDVNPNRPQEGSTKPTPITYTLGEKTSSAIRKTQAGVNARQQAKSNQPYDPESDLDNRQRGSEEKYKNPNSDWGSSMGKPVPMNTNEINTIDKGAKKVYETPDGKFHFVHYGTTIDPNTKQTVLDQSNVTRVVEKDKNAVLTGLSVANKGVKSAPTAKEKNDQSRKKQIQGFKLISE
jgi:hypothetical protein